MIKKYFNNRFVQGILLAACLFLTALIVGGELLHDQLHHHQSREAQQDCPVFIIQNQAVVCIAVVTLLAGLIEFKRIPSKTVVRFLPTKLSSFYLRGPPVIV